MVCNQLHLKRMYSPGILGKYRKEWNSWRCSEGCWWWYNRKTLFSAAGRGSHCKDWSECCLQIACGGSSQYLQLVVGSRIFEDTKEGIAGRWLLPLWSSYTEQGDSGSLQERDIIPFAADWSCYKNNCK